MATYHEPTAESGGDYDDYFKRVKAWEWVNMITLLTATQRSLRLRTQVAEQGDRRVWDWLDQHLSDGIDHATANAAACFLDSHDKDAYEQFLKSKHYQQRLRGIITSEEYWQAFAVFLTEYEPF